MSTWKDSANPFNQLINKVTFDDNLPNVPYYQTEQVKDAAFQSDHGSESIHKALLYRLDHGTPCVQHKCLFLIRTLMLEGPAGFSARMSTNMGKINSLANNNDVKKGSLADSVRILSGAVQQAVNGDSKALARVASQGTAPEKELVKQSLKSDFQLQQEKELKAFKAKQKESKVGAVMVNEKLLQQFDSTLTPVKFVQAALHSDKKKYNADELVAFNAAAQETISVTEVATALDNALREGSSPLAIRYKALQLVDALLPDSTDTDVMRHFRSKSIGIQRHTTLERSDNPTKSQMTQQLAAAIMEKISAANQMAVETQKVESTTKFQQFTPAPALVEPTPQGAPIDQMFGGMSPAGRVRGSSTTSRPGQGQQPPARQQQQQPQAQSWGGDWGAPAQPQQAWGAPPAQQQQMPPQQFQQTPQQQQQQFQQPAMQQYQQQQNAVPQQQLQQQQQAMPPQAAPAVPQAAPAPGATPDLAEQMAQFQKNMMLMQQMMSGGGAAVQQQQPAPPAQQQAPPPVQQQQQQQPAQPQPLWGSSANMPPPIPEHHSEPSSNNGSVYNSATRSRGESPAHIPQSTSNGNLSNTAGSGSFVPPPNVGSSGDLGMMNQQPSGSQQDLTHLATPAPPSPPAPTAAPVAPAANPNAETIALLQAQMAETQKVMMQQQQMLATLLAQQQQQQPPQ